MPKVLFIDDDLLARANTIALLEDYGFEVVGCRSPNEALKNAMGNAHTIDVILLDLMMPTDEAVTAEESDNGILTGLVLFKKHLRGILKTGTPVIVLTGVSGAKALEEVRSIPEIVEILRRPVTISKVADALKRAISFSTRS